MARPALPRPCLMLVTDRRVCEGPLEEVVARAVEAGVDAVQVREKDLPARDLLDLCMRLRAVTLGRALLLVNDRADVALACGADGVHLGEQSLPTRAVRWLVGEDRLVGRSVHSPEGAEQAEKEGADYLVLGTLFPTESHPGAPAGGLALLNEVTRRVRIPVLGIGGITPEKVPFLLQARAWGVAVIRGVLAQPDPAEAVRRFREALRWGR